MNEVCNHKGLLYWNKSKKLMECSNCGAAFKMFTLTDNNMGEEKGKYASFYSAMEDYNKTEIKGK